MIAYSKGRRPRPRALARASGLITTLLLAVTGTAHSQSLQTYIIRDLGSLGGESRAMGVNSQGYAVGYYIDIQGRQRPFRWDLGIGMVDIGSFFGAAGSGIAYGINDSGVVVGTATNSLGYKRAFMTGPFASINPATDDLGTFGGNEAEARGISNTGYVAGFAMLANGRNRAFRYYQGSMLNLGVFDQPSAESYGLSVNDLGQVAGHSEKNSQHGRAFRYNGDIPPTLEDLGLNLRYSEGAFINSAGSVVGTEARSTLWNGFIFTDAARLSMMAPGTTATGINDDGVIVGTIPVGNDTHGYVNRGNGNEDVVDLLTGPSAAGFIGAGKSIGLTGIANSGHISGWGDGAAGRHAIRLVPYTVNLTSVSPSLVPVGADFTLTANGFGFSRACQINWNGTPLATTFVSITQLTASVPASMVSSAGSAAITITIPTAAGSSNSQTVVIGDYSVTAGPASVLMGQPINVSWSAPAGTSVKDWVGLYKVGSGDQGCIAFQYTNGTSAGSISFTAPWEAGQYEVRYLLNDGYQSVTSSSTFTVQP